MEKQATLRARIADVVATFAKDQVSNALELVSVSLQPDMLFITLRSVTCPAEKDLAREERGRTLLVNLYSRAFDSVKRVLESHIEEILGRPVTGSAITVDPESGNGIMSFRLLDRPNSDAEDA
jgi:uncharacterized protein YbcI